MTIPNMAFTPANGLRDVSVYPTVPASESDLRDEIQRGMDQLRDHFNDNIATKALDKTGDTMTGALIMSSTAPYMQFTDTDTIDSKTWFYGLDGSTIWWREDAIGNPNTLAISPGGVVSGKWGNMLQAVSGGYKNQSGKVSITTGTTGYTVTFPTAFATIPVVNVSLQLGAGSFSQISITSLSATSVTFQLSTANNGTLHWSAIGS